MEVKKKLFLIDAYALIFRGYYAFIKNPRINSKGLDTSAILGFTNSLFDVIKREKPEFLAVCLTKEEVRIGLKFMKNIRQTGMKHLKQSNLLFRLLRIFSTL